MKPSGRRTSFLPWTRPWSSVAIVSDQSLSSVVCVLRCLASIVASRSRTLADHCHGLEGPEIICIYTTCVSRAPIWYENGKSVFRFYHFYARFIARPGHARATRTQLCAERRASERVPGSTRRESDPKYRRRVDRARRHPRRGMTPNQARAPPT